MRFQKLRVVGFKTFVEPADLLIEPGLTGVVGPNGCGKSNLVEALRWVMGETSFKNMRAGGMDDVIFAGGGNRPARNMAEVGLVLDNAARTAPAGFNDTDIIEVTRRIQRGVGSSYRINGREVRAKDVQILFADASSGARSPAMVRQGQISEIISARPQARRRILEEAAGIAGLHSRRHEASLRLKAADDNVVRLNDVLDQIGGQAEALRRQARQAARYKALSADIRRQGALLFLIGYGAVEAELAEARRRLDLDTREVAARTLAQAEAARAAAVAAAAVPALREVEARAGEALQRLVVAREALEGEERRAKDRAADLDRRIAQSRQTLAREGALIGDADATLGRLGAEEQALVAEAEVAGAASEMARLRLAAADARLAACEAAFAQAQAEAADAAARRNGFERGVAEEAQRAARHEAERVKLARERDALLAGGDPDRERAEAAAALGELVRTAEAAETQAVAAERRHAGAREAELAIRGPLADAAGTTQRLETEVRTLRKLLDTGGGGGVRPVLEAVEVTRGYEAALGAALGDDLGASLDPKAATHWSAVPVDDADPALPEGAEPLGAFVRAPAALARRLAQIGLVERSRAPHLVALLKPGQRLVSREGDLWRWDGLSSRADAPRPAARRLAERNRLGELATAAERASEVHRRLQAEAAGLQADQRAAALAEGEARGAARTAARRLEEARQRSEAAERQRAAATARLAGLDEALTRVSAARDEALARRAAAAAALVELAPGAQASAELEAARREVTRERAEQADARAALGGLGREAEARARRQAAIARERTSWTERAAAARRETSGLEERLAEAEAERAALAEAPDDFFQRRRALVGDTAAAEQARNAAADARASAEKKAGDADRAARAALDAMSRAREARTRSDADTAALGQRRDDLVRTIAADLGCAPAELPGLAGLAPGSQTPSTAETERRLESLRQERERLGGVNLRAEEELAGVEQTRAGLLAERDDLTEAVKRLRQGIQNLNREGRERLVRAFDVVNGHFRDLFTTLFGGGTAELQLVESEDPLEAGLEILARPPGKKPATMTLLSGGEQALTALALIFGVFLTNPSPICVLDEVDAPLDDANVERFCDLLADMARRTDTRFLTITHNPITMARMDRLFGVTMAERGVSQLVSVDLGTAEQFRVAG